MRKIVIVTYFGGANYGSQLQATGLYKYLSNKGYDVNLMRYFRDIPFYLKHPRMLYARIQKKFSKKKWRQFFITSPYHITEKREQRIQKYNHDNYKEIKVLSDRDWKQLIKDNPLFVAGSDIIWQPVNGYPSMYFLDMAYYAKLDCFSYASSLGTKELPRKFYSAYKRYLGSYKAIGVREQKAADLLSGIVGKPVTKVIDPTLLLDENEWRKIAEKAEISEKLNDTGYVLCYFVMRDERYWEFVEKVKKETQLQIVVLPMHDLDEEQPYTIIKDGTPYEFLYLIEHAEFVCTDSFHAAVFSFQFEKEYYILPRERKDEDDKFEDLLNRYSMQDRKVVNEDCFERNSCVNYTKGKMQLASDREAAFWFINKCFE